MKKILSCMAFLLCISHAQAAVIHTEATLVGSNQLVIDYDITADSFDIGGFTFFFDALLFDNIRISANPDTSNWDSFVAQSENFFGFLDDGFADFAALSTPIAVGETLAGFQVTLDIIGATVPTEFSQSVDVFDFDDFSFSNPESVLVDGVQIETQSVSAPSVIALFVFGLSALTLRRKQARKFAYKTSLSLI